VRQRHRAERNHAIGTLPQAFVESVGPANRERQGGCARVPQFGDIARKIFAGETGALFIECPQRPAFGKQRRNTQRFVNLAVVGTARAAFGDFANVQGAEPDGTPGRTDALAVARHKLPFGAGLQPADAENLKAQDPLGASDDAPLACALARAVDAPHLLEIVELANLGTEDVDDDVVGIDEHPVAMRQALDTRRRQAGLLT
jgi:hypothetical protein